MCIYIYIYIYIYNNEKNVATYLFLYANIDVIFVYVYIYIYNNEKNVPFLSFPFPGDLFERLGREMIMSPD